MEKDHTSQLFRTPVAIGSIARPLTAGDTSVFLGSCFAEHIGSKFAEQGLLTTVNPLGVMYNPMSISRLLSTAESNADRDFAEHGGMWHTWLGDSSLSCPSQSECQRLTDEALARLHKALSEADNLFLTLGTSHYYMLRNGNGQCVANCHRFPASTFEEAELETDDIVAALEETLTAWHERNPRLQVIFTVSPYRYAKYGFHQSQLSKSRLLLAIDKLCRKLPKWTSYFPAYEIMIDELRDYRFYADDMLHPSAQAVDYIWQRLTESWMADDMLAFLRRSVPLHQALNHRPLNVADPAYQAFRRKTEEQLEALRKDYPNLNL